MKQISKAAATLVFAGFVLFAPAPAGYASTGIFIGIEARHLQPTGVPTDYVLVDPDGDGEPEGTLENVEFSNEISPRLLVGWESVNGSAVHLSWWNWDESETDSVSASSPMELWDILYHPGSSFGNYEGSAMAEAGLDATVIDLVYSGPAHSRERLRTRWSAGLRQAKLEHELDVAYDDGLTTETVRLRSEAEGIGLFAGIFGIFHFTRHSFLAGGAYYSFLSGDVESSTLMFDSMSGAADPDADVSRNEDRVIGILDASIMVVWKLGERIELSVGYEFSQWNNVIDTLLFPDEANPGFVHSTSSDVSWDGWTVGIGVSF